MVSGSPKQRTPCKDYSRGCNVTPIKRAHNVLGPEIRRLRNNRSGSDQSDAVLPQEPFVQAEVGSKLLGVLVRPSWLARNQTSSQYSSVPRTVFKLLRPCITHMQVSTYIYMMLSDAEPIKYLKAVLVLGFTTGYKMTHARAHTQNETEHPKQSSSAPFPLLSWEAGEAGDRQHAGVFCQCCQVDLETMLATSVGNPLCGNILMRSKLLAFSQVAL